MNIKSNEKKENSTVELVIEVGAAEWNAALDKVYNRQKKKIALPGFRRGKASRKMVEAMYGAEVFYEDALELAYPDAYSQALEESGVKSVAYPKIEIQDVGKDGFTFKAVVTVKPEVKVKDYKGMSAPKAEVKVTDEDVAEELKVYIDRATRLVSVEREARTGDTVVIDFEGFKDGKAFEGGKGTNYSLELGSGSFIPGFEEQVAGMKIGEEKDLNVTFPEDYNAEELAGVPVVFKVTLHEVKERQEPVVDDEFAKDVSEFNTLEELKKDLADKLAKRRQEAADKEFENALIQKLADDMQCDVPEAMVEFRADQMAEEYARQIQSRGIKFEDYLRMMGMTAEQFRDQAKSGAERGVRADLALEAVADAEGIQVTEEDVEAELQRLADMYSMKLDQVKAAVPEEEVKNDLRTKKAIELIVSTAKAEKPEKAAKKSAKKAADKAEDEEKAAKKSAKKTADKAEDEGKAAKKARKKKEEEQSEGEEKPKKATKKSAKKTEE